MAFLHLMFISSIAAPFILAVAPTILTFCIKKKKFQKHRLPEKLTMVINMYFNFILGSNLTLHSYFSEYHSKFTLVKTLFLSAKIKLLLFSFSNTAEAALIKKGN